MGTWKAPCGCTVSTSMFGNYPTLSITLCFHHADDKEVGMAMRMAHDKIRDAAKTDPGYYEYNKKTGHDEWKRGFRDE